MHGGETMADDVSVSWEYFRLSLDLVQYELIESGEPTGKIISAAREKWLTRERKEKAALVLPLLLGK